MTKNSKNNLKVFPIDSKPYGMTYGEWAAKWWQWALSIPKEKNPIDDKTGENCDQQQNDPNVWFLAGTHGGFAERKCDIPVGKGILFPIINAECSYAEFPDLKTESELRMRSEAQAMNLEVTIDGANLQDLDKYWVQSQLFNVTMPDNNVLGITPGPTQAIASGYWILVESLPIGKHELHFGGVDIHNFATEVTYHLTVKL